MAKPVILAVDDPPGCCGRSSGDLPIEYGFQDRMPPAGADGSSLDILDRFSARPLHPFPFPQPLASSWRRTGAASNRSVEVADNDPAETSRVVRVQRRESKIEKGRFA